MNGKQYSRENKGKGHSHTAEAHKRVLGRVVVQNQAIAGTSKSGKTHGCNTNKEEDGNRKARSHDGVPSINGVVFKLKIELWRIEIFIKKDALNKQ
jgi:hypothetical protein